MRNFISLLVGLVFGIGLCISGMTEPAKVVGFLDITGLWDPSLGFVMGGAVAVGLVAFWLAKRRKIALDGEPMQLPAARIIDAPLIVGSVIFGVGWGVSGICPGPGIVDIGFLNPRAIVFVGAMVVGMLAYRLVGLRVPTPNLIGEDA